MPGFARTNLLIAMAAPICLLLFCSVSAQNSRAPVTQPASGGTRGPSSLLFSQDGLKLYVAEQDENAVAILDPDGSTPPIHISSGGEQPTALALMPNGRTLLTANSFSGSVGVIDLEKRTLTGRLPLKGVPGDIAVAPNGRAFITVSQLDEVAVMDVAAMKIVARIPVGRRPRTLRFTPDNSTLLCAGLGDGTLSVIDVATQQERSRIKLPAINLRGLAVSADGTHAYVTGQQPHNEKPTADPLAMWSNLLCCVKLVGQTCSFERAIALDEQDRGAADPCGIALNNAGDTAYIALSGTHQAIVVPLRIAGNDPVRFPRIAVGANPRAVVARPHSTQVWIGNHLGNSLSVVDARDNTERRVGLNPPTPSPNRRLRGRFLFADARLARGNQFSCESCHPDGGTDGLSWKFSHVTDQPSVRNTRDLRGPLLLTGPYGWSAREQDFELFVNDEIMGLMRTHKLSHTDVHAFWDLINETSQPPNPYRSATGKFTPSAARGMALFGGEAACIACHSGGQRGGGPSSAWVGTTPKGVKLDVPHLVGVHDTAPFLHDGSAKSLEDIFTTCDPGHAHGKAHLLSTAQRKDLLEYVREL